MALALQLALVQRRCRDSAIILKEKWPGALPGTAAASIPAGVDGAVVSASGSRPVLPLRVEVDGIPAAVEYVGGAPGEVSGLMQSMCRFRRA